MARASASPSTRALLAEERLVANVAVEHRQDHIARRTAALDDLQELAEGHQLLDRPLELIAADLGAVRQHHDPRLDRALDQPGLERPLIADERLAAPALRTEERRLRDIHISAVDQRAHLAVEERQQERADVRSVNVRVGHDDDPVVADLGRIEILGADAAPSAAIIVLISSLLSILSKRARSTFRILPLIGRIA